MIPETETLYKFPWTKHNHPHGWVEVTTYCNMACPGCYRGCDRKRRAKIHKPIEEIKKEILLLKKIRNCQTISLSGGEPLLHPELREIINFIRKNGMNSNILTNGLLLNETLLTSLKQNGLTGISIRIDSLSKRGQKSEEALNPLREKYVDLVRKVGGIFLGFICVINKKNVSEIPKVIKWFQNNNEKVELLVLILKRQRLYSRKEKIDDSQEVSLNKLLDEIYTKVPELEYGAYLGSPSKEPQVDWIWSFWINFNEKRIGYLNRKIIKFSQESYYSKNKRYFYMLKKREYFLSIWKFFLLSILNGNLRKMSKKTFSEIIKNPASLGKKFHLQQIIIVNPPGFDKGERKRLCEECPDATLYQGKLVPSCLLEEIKLSKKIPELK